VYLTCAWEVNKNAPGKAFKKWMNGKTRRETCAEIRT
jgi:hypothetical protein